MASGWHEFEAAEEQGSADVRDTGSAGGAGGEWAEPMGARLLTGGVLSAAYVGFLLWESAAGAWSCVGFGVLVGAIAVALGVQASGAVRRGRRARPGRLWT